MGRERHSARFDGVHDADARVSEADVVPFRVGVVSRLLAHEVDDAIDRLRDRVCVLHHGAEVVVDVDDFLGVFDGRRIRERPAVANHFSEVDRALVMGVMELSTGKS